MHRDKDLCRKLLLDAVREPLRASRTTSDVEAYHVALLIDGGYLIDTGGQLEPTLRAIETARRIRSDEAWTESKNRIRKAGLKSVSWDVRMELMGSLTPANAGGDGERLRA